MRKWTTITALMAVAAVTVAWTQIPMKAEDAKIRLSGFEADGWELWLDRNRGWNHTIEYRWWTFDEGGHTGEVAFWYSTEDAGYWTSEVMRKRGFLTHFGWLKDRGSNKKGLSKGPTITSVMGDIETTMFDADTQTYGEDLRECIGFRHWWDRFRDGHKKVLEVYACGLDGKRMTEEQFVEILRGVSVEGEFDALVMN